MTAISSTCPNNSSCCEGIEIKNRFEYIPHNTKIWDRLSENNSPLATALKITLVVPAILLAMEAVKNAAIALANVFIGAANVATNLILGPRVFELLPSELEIVPELSKPEIVVESAIVEEPAAVLVQEPMEPVVEVAPSSEIVQPAPVSAPSEPITLELTDDFSDASSTISEDLVSDASSTISEDLQSVDIPSVDASDLEDEVVDAPASSRLPKWVTLGNAVKLTVATVAFYGSVRYIGSVWTKGFDATHTGISDSISGAFAKSRDFVGNIPSYFSRSSTPAAGNGTSSTPAAGNGTSSTPPAGNGTSSIPLAGNATEAEGPQIPAQTEA